MLLLPVAVSVLRFALQGPTFSAASERGSSVALRPRRHLMGLIEHAGEARIVLARPVMPIAGRITYHAA